MDSPQSVVLSSNNTVPELQKQTSDLSRNSPQPSKEIQFNGHPEDLSEGSIGSLEVYVHQARGIHNICIYQKQDVYAKICLTSHPDDTVSTKIINGGGMNPVFNDNLKLNVRKLDCSLKCEIWMLSRVKNYLKDQLLGFALVPLSEVILNNGRIEKEFSLSSTDLFHSPAGFVQLSLSYNGASPEVMEITPSPSADAPVKESVVAAAEAIPCDLDKIEFPDPKIVNENEMMVSEYFGMPCESLESETSESFDTSGAENKLHSEQNFENDAFESMQLPKLDSPLISVSTNGASSPSIPTSTQSSEAPSAAIKSPAPSEEHESRPPELAKKDQNGESSEGVSSSPFAKPVISVNLEPEQNAVQQQDIVDMYMKSMQQFTESLAKMKLPLDLESEKANPEKNSSSEENASKNNGSRVFYGSRAFF
ncbi:hypothetical protein SAY86_016026 [Trapa natans]|uniref:C2 domain-containing protein n=1 Tax=Trapa natans TaxID=22666 RepID=A0AAN7QW02_TRANT|nr:hypothetical protein SAY86_016026 [Trapa natans]